MYTGLCVCLCLTTEYKGSCSSIHLPKSAKQQRSTTQPKQKIKSTSALLQMSTQPHTHEAWGKSAVLELCLGYMNKPHWVGALQTHGHDKVGHYSVSLPSFCRMHPDNTHMKLQGLQARDRFTAPSLSVALFLSPTHAVAFFSLAACVLPLSDRHFLPCNRPDLTSALLCSPVQSASVTGCWMSEWDRCAKGGEMAIPLQWR